MLIARWMVQMAKLNEILITGNVLYCTFTRPLDHGLLFPTVQTLNFLIETIRAQGS